MEKIFFKTEINASTDRVWSVLWGDSTYSEWTSAFAEGSKAVTDWKEGSKVLFMDGNNDGMVSEIAKSIPGKFMSFKQVGLIEKGVENMESAKVKGWYGAFENYTLNDVGGKTELLVEMDTVPEFKEYLEKAWPASLEKLKEIAEQPTELV